MLSACPEIESGASGPMPRTGDYSLGEPVMGRSWYAVSVYPRHEKQVAQMCEIKGVNYLLPLYSSVRRWKDRRKRLDMVLFPGYVFVNIALTERLRVLVLPGVARFVTFHGQPAVVPDHEIRVLGLGAEGGLSIQPHPYLQKGRLVRVRNGPMSGVEGILVRRKDRFRVIISIDLIMRSVAAEVDEGDIEPVD
jgi:transcription antitermination factor NusG